MNIQQQKWWGSVRNLPSLQEETYEEFFKKALDKFGVSSPDELDDDKKKELFNWVEKNWTGEKNESTDCTDCKEVEENEVEEASIPDPDAEEEEEEEEEVEESVDKDKEVLDFINENWG
jgi:hypothetical protein